jgi:hypothetical protein
MSRNHGTTTAYREGCRCTDCRRACADAQARRRKRQYLARVQQLSVPNIGTRRRIQSLVALGWSLSEISRQAGWTRSLAALIIRRQGPLHEKTARECAAIYERLSNQLPPRDTKGQRIDYSRARNMAARNGWLPPIWWDNLDDPDERPSMHDTSAPDPVVIDRILAGDFTLRATRDERWEVIRRWAGSDGELERRTSWNVARDRREMKAREEAEDAA